MNKSEGPYCSVSFSVRYNSHSSFTRNFKDNVVVSTLGDGSPNAQKVIRSKGGEDGVRRG